ncbi:MAG: hypothetical protein WCT03_00520 [Candidatus Obscuribacterales bacterium]|jgi:hypothetical protein
MENSFDIKHPYWNIYERLLGLNGNKPDGKTKKDLREISQAVDFTLQNRLWLEMLMLLPWFSSEMAFELYFSKMREKFCYSILSPAMLRFLRGYSPLVEMGAGNGYNAWLLRQMGADVEAIEAFPVEEGKNWFFGTNTFGLPARMSTSWSPVTKGDAKDLEKFADRTLLISWPPINSMASEALNYYHGSHIVLIANRKNCANNAFYKSLSTNWHLIYSTETDAWGGFQIEWLELYSRLGAPIPSIHPHSHEEVEHTHLHLHDEHHDHDNDHSHTSDFRHPHSHQHRHNKRPHNHPHIEDQHHSNEPDHEHN